MNSLTLTLAARIVREAMDAGRWRDTELGQAASDYIEALEYQEAALNTLAAYEYVLGLFVAEHADLTLADLEPPRGNQAVRAFLDRLWRKAAPATRSQRLAIVRSFLTWMVGEGMIRANPATKHPRAERAPDGAAGALPRRRGAADRRPPSLRDQVALMCLAWMGLRKSELARLRISDFNIAARTVTVHGRGGHEDVLPIGFERLRVALELHLQEREPAPGEHLLYPKISRTRPMDIPACTGGSNGAWDALGCPRT